MDNNKKSKDSKKEEVDKTKVYKTKKNKEKFSKKHPKLMLIIKILIVIFVFCILIGAGIVAGIFYGLFGDDFKITKEDLIISNMNTVILDKDGNNIGTMAGEEIRQKVTLSDMPKYLPDAYVAIEDERFEKHHGVDIKRTLAAAVTYVFNRGQSSFGGSTITQQLVKNITNEKEDSGIEGIIRKIKEMSKAYQIEKLISKDQILELYLNILFVGGPGNHGVQMGAKYYFDKNVGDLTLEECAFLAGINHSPNKYNPFTNMTDEKSELIKNRTKTVLNKMLELGKINKEEHDGAVAKVNEGLNFQKGKTVENTYSYLTEAAINQVVKDLAEKNGWDENFAKMKLQSGGYTIHTTQDSGIQSIMEEEFAKDTYVKKSKKTKLKDEDGNDTDTYATTQAAMVIIDYRSGHVVGLVGGLGEKTSTGNLNRATQMVRQPGSATKPISTIAPAINEKIITAGTVYYDGKTSFSATYSPKNDNNVYRGLLTVRDAIAYSQNMVPLKIMVELTPGKSIDYMRKMGVSTLYKHGEDDKKDDESLPLAIGGISDGISPLEMAAAYGTIANDGLYVSPIFYTSVTDENGNVVLEPTQKQEEAITKQAAYITKSILTQPVLTGTATYCAISGMDVSAKTGTTNNSYDRWLCGFTPYYAAATWFGYDQLEEILWSGRNPAGQIWSNIMKEIHSGLEKKRYERPDDIVTATICKESGKLAGENCSKTTSEVFIKGTQPTQKCDAHLKIKICKESGKIATEFCTDTEEKDFKAKPEKELDVSWNTTYGDEMNAPTEMCPIHTAQVPEEPVTPEEPDEPEEPTIDNTIDNTTNTTNSVNNTNTTNSTNSTNSTNTSNTTNSISNET